MRGILRQCFLLRDGDDLAQIVDVEPFRVPPLFRRIPGSFPLFPMFSQLIDNIGDLIHEYFGVLNSRYIDDMLRDMSRALEDAITAGCDVRYLLIDGETGQLESRTLYLTEEEANEAAEKPEHGKHCSVAVLLIG